MAYSITSPKIGFPALTVTGTTQLLPLGTKVEAGSNGTTGAIYGEGSFIYLLGVANTVVGSPVFYGQYAGTTALAGSGGKGLMAIAMSANGSGAYGWYQTRGAAAIVTAAATAALAAQLTTSAGTLSSANSGSSTTRISNAVFVTGTGTPSAGLAVVQIDSPGAEGAN